MPAIPTHVRLRVTCYATAVVALLLLPWGLPIPRWQAATTSAALLAAGCYALWCFWPRLTWGFGPGTLDVLPVVPGQPFRLTFDDGPTPDLTDRVLDLLAERGVRASFFVLSAKAERAPALVRRIVAEGHVLGLHGEHHAPPFFRTTDELTASLARARATLEAIAGQPVSLYRPSHGWKNAALVGAVRRLRLQVAGWQAGVWDTDAPAAAVLTARLWSVTPERVTASAPVVLLHDGLDDDPGVPHHADVLLEALRRWLPPSQRQGPPRRTAPWHRAGVAAVWLALGAWAAHGVAWGPVTLAFRSVPPATVAGVAVAAWLATALQALRFYFLFPGGLGTARHIALNFALQTGNVLLPARTGELVRPFYMKRWNPSLPLDELVTWSVLDKAAEVLAFLPFLAAAAFFSRWLWPALGVATLAAIVVARHARRRAGPAPARVPSPRRIALSIGCSALGWAANLAIFWLIAGDRRLALALLAGVNLAAAIPALPAGLGAFEAAFVWVGHLGGLPADRALGLALVAHLAQVGATLSVGVPALVRWGWPHAEPAGVRTRTPGRYLVSNVGVYVVAMVMVIASGALWRPVRRRPKAGAAPVHPWPVPAARAVPPRVRVALVSEFFYPTLGGIQDHLRYFSRELIRRGHEPWLVTPRVLGARPKEEWWPADLPPGMHHEVGHSLPYFVNGSLGRLTAGAGVAQALGRLLTPDHVDLAHLHSPLAGTLPILAMARASVPVVGTVHTSFGSSASLAALRPLAQRQLDALAAGIAVSPVSLDSIRQYLRFDARVIPNGIDTAAFRPRRDGPDDSVPRYRDGRINIFFIGRPDPRNGLDALIRAFARVHRATPATRLLIAGDGELMYRYREMAAALVADPDAVAFLGAVRDDRPALYRTADIHVFPVERAAFSVTLLEGMASGLPVITTAWTGHAFMGTPGRHFETMPFDDDAALERLLRDYIAHPARREALGRQARAHALGYDWSAITDRILDVYAEALDRRIGTERHLRKTAS